MSPWYGWLRKDKRHRWRCVVGPCTSMAECSRLLGAVAQRRGVLDRNTIMNTGAYPQVDAATPTAGLTAAQRADLLRAEVEVIAAQLAEESHTTDTKQKEQG
jgi:hypothetical protein